MPPRRAPLKCLLLGLSMPGGYAPAPAMPFAHRPDASFELGSAAGPAVAFRTSGTASLPDPVAPFSGRTTMFAKPLMAAALGCAALSFAAPALAGDCPQGKEIANSLAGAPTMPSGVTDDVIGSIDLNKEIMVDGRLLRTRRLVVQPGGIVPMHSHNGRPALIYTVSGTIIEHRSSCAVPIVHKAGDIAREADGISHWWKNEGKTPVVLLSSDVFKPN
jgi:quercetin dioxygenase-like cupin family protein